MGPAFDNRLRPVIELLPATVNGGLAGVLALRPELLAPLMPAVAQALAAVLGAGALWRDGRTPAGAG